MDNHDSNLDHVLDQLSILDPQADEQPVSSAKALTRLKSNIDLAEQEPVGLFSAGRLRSFNHMLTFQQKLVRGSAFAALAVAIAFFGFSPVGQAMASDFLGIFRVQKFAPISISPERLAELEELDIEGLYPGEFVWNQVPVEPAPVNSFEEAATAVGFESRAVGFEATLGSPDEIAVGGDGSGQMTVDLAAARAILEIAGVDSTLLPDSLDGAEVTFEVGNGIFTSWDNGMTVFIEMESPSVNYPSDFDPAPIGQALLQFLGTPEDEAIRLSQSIDWTNTLVMPIPQGMADYQEVSVNGSPGILITSLDDHGNSLMWEANGMVYMLSGEMSGDELVTLANN